MHKGMPCGCGKPYTVYSDNPKMDTSGMAQRKVPSYGGGGRILPAASMGSEVFVRAAQRAGLNVSKNPSTDSATRTTLNKIVSLVNQGMSPDEAARQVANNRGTYKSGGYVYSDKNDPDTMMEMDDMDEEDK
jgi:hypothetical protein